MRSVRVSHTGSVLFSVWARKPRPLLPRKKVKKISKRAIANRQKLLTEDKQKPRRANEVPPVSAFVINFGQISSESVSSYIIFLYDDVYSMLYFEEYQPPC